MDYGFVVGVASLRRFSKPGVIAGHYRREDEAPTPYRQSWCQPCQTTVRPQRLPLK